MDCSIVNYTLKERYTDYDSSEYDIKFILKKCPW